MRTARPEPSAARKRSNRGNLRRTRHRGGRLTPAPVCCYPLRHRGSLGLHRKRTGDRVSIRNGAPPGRVRCFLRNVHRAWMAERRSGGTRSVTASATCANVKWSIRSLTKARSSGAVSSRGCRPERCSRGCCSGGVNRVFGGVQHPLHRRRRAQRGQWPAASARSRAATAAAEPSRSSAAHLAILRAGSTGLSRPAFSDRASVQPGTRSDATSTRTSMVGR
ncbi:hypothetical protein PARU111607_01420 [Palleronia rufa]